MKRSDASWCRTCCKRTVWTATGSIRPSSMAAFTCRAGRAMCARSRRSPSIFPCRSAACASLAARVVSCGAMCAALRSKKWPWSMTCKSTTKKATCWPTSSTSAARAPARRRSPSAIPAMTGCTFRNGSVHRCRTPRRPRTRPRFSRNASRCAMQSRRRRKSTRRRSCAPVSPRM